MNSKKVDCKKCKYYYITWDVAFPYGCKVYEVKSKQMPSIIVYQSLGKECESYEIKDRMK